VNNRAAKIQRYTKETQVDIELNLDGVGESDIDTPNGMLNHMLEQIARHGLMDLKVTAKGDVSPGWHHMVEDVGIVFGQAFRESVGEGRGIVRTSSITLPLDETLVMVAIDIGGRPYSVVKAVFRDSVIGDMPSDLVRHFFEVFALEAKVNLHAKVLEGTNDHHKAEALFKALARAIRAAVVIDSRITGEVPSTKGTINS
tara:strand:- start:427 stop:1026 length:600 start_codon:yes stop_codon:yes gene_type:complete